MSNDGPSNPEGLVFRDWKQDEGPVLPPYEGVPLHSPGRGLAWIHSGPGPEHVFLPKDATVVPTTPAPAKDFDVVIHKHVIDERMRVLIHEEVQRALYPGGGIVTHEHRRIDMYEQDGSHWRGMLYRVDDNTTDPEMPAAQERVPGGTCWACGTRGESAEMMWYNPAPHEGKRSHLIHATAECIRAAALKPEEREHHG